MTALDEGGQSYSGKSKPTVFVVQKEKFGEPKRLLFTLVNSLIVNPIAMTGLMSAPRKHCTE